MDRKALIATITKYHDYKRFIHTSSIEEAKWQLSKLPRYSVQRAVLETEVNFYGFMSKVESVASRLTGSDAELFKRLLRMNTTRRLSTIEMAKELGLSDYRFTKAIDSIIEKINRIKKGD